MLVHFVATTATACYLAYHGVHGPVAVMECPTEAVAQAEADRRNEYARAAALVARLSIHDVHPIHVKRRAREPMYGPAFGDFAD